MWRRRARAALGRDLYQGASTQVVALLNITYPPGGPLANWGGSMKGSVGYPVQVASGTFAAGNLFQLGLDWIPDTALGKSFAASSSVHVVQP